MKAIVFNRHDGGISICYPTDWAISAMGCGGLWNNHARGFMDIQIERQIARGVPSDIARRYARAMQFGGCTTAEALEIIRDRDCLGGIAHELWDKSDVPKDRWFRNAWRRSHNGGPIYVSLELARPIQLQYISEEVRATNLKRAAILLPPLEFDFRQVRKQVADARTPLELQRVRLPESALNIRN